MNYVILGREFQRVFRHRWEVFLSQGFTLVIAVIFAFLLQDILPLYPQIGTSFYWLSQSFSLLLLSHSVFKQDMSQGFMLNVLNSRTSLPSFLLSRWIIFTFALTLCAGMLSPLLLLLLGISLENWRYVLLLLFPFNGLGLAYGALLILLIEGVRGYLLAFLLLPLLLPLFVFSVGGVSSEYFGTLFLASMGILFLILPFVIGISTYILRDLCHSAS